MIFGDNKIELRRMYITAWQKRQTGAVLSPLEAQIASVIEDHPEYHDMMSEEAIDATFTPERGQTNPFLHMGLHLAVREQVATDRPAGIGAIFNSVHIRLGDAHEAEHKMLECLAEILWKAQSDDAMPDDQAYLEHLQETLGR